MLRGLAVGLEIGVGSLGLAVCPVCTMMRLYFLRRNLGVEEESRICCPNERLRNKQKL